MKKDTKISEESCIIKNIKAVLNGRSIFSKFVILKILLVSAHLTTQVEALFMFWIESSFPVIINR